MKPVDGLLGAEVNGRPVKNLGWLLRNWKKVERFSILPHPPVVRGLPPDAVLVAHLRNDEGEYKTGFSDAGILVSFLDRPVFRGLHQNWKITKPQPYASR